MSKQTWDALPVKAVLKNVALIFKTRDIYKMTKKTYQVLSLMSGFIAHYNHHGFMCEYENVSELARDILNSMDAKDPERYTRDKWFENEYGETYCKSKTEIYTGLANLAKHYLNQLEEHDYLVTKNRELALARSIFKKYDIKIEA